MKPTINFFLILLMFLPFQIPVFAQNSANRIEVFPRIEPDPVALGFHKPGNYNYSWIELAEISLWASGDATASCLEQIHKIAEAIKASSRLLTTSKEKAEFILDYMHKNLLKSYSANQTRVDVLLSNGRFNCVSSSVLYLILCKSVGLNVVGVTTKDHAFVSVYIDGKNIDVETTNPYGFNPGDHKEFHDQFGRLTGFAYVPPQNYRDRHAITPIELISIILRNRISELEAGNRFVEAVPLAVDRAALLNGDIIADKSAYSGASFFDSPYQSLLNRLFNYGIFLLKSGREEDCLRWAALVSPKYPEESRWQEFIFAAVNNRITKFLKASQVAEARNFLNSQKHVLSSANYTQFDNMLIDAELVNNANRISNITDGNNVVAAIAEARTNHKINDKRANELLTFAVRKTASILSGSPEQDWLAAINYVENAIARFGSNPELEQTLRLYRNNRATYFHNRFAAAWNKKNFVEAERIINEGLAEFPNDRQLLKDRGTVNKHRQ